MGFTKAKTNGISKMAIFVVVGILSLVLGLWSTDPPEAQAPSPVSEPESLVVQRFSFFHTTRGDGELAVETLWRSQGSEH